MWKLWVILILDDRRRLVDSYFEVCTGSEGILFKFALCRAFHSQLWTVLGGSITTGRPNRRKVGRSVKMVKISFQQVTVQKPEKENDGDKEEIHMPYSHVSYSFLFIYIMVFVLLSAVKPSFVLSCSSLQNGIKNATSIYFYLFLTMLKNIYIF